MDDNTHGAYVEIGDISCWCWMWPEWMPRDIDLLWWLR